MEVSTSTRVGMDVLAERVGERRRKRMDMMKVYLRDAIRKACLPDVCLELVRMSVEFAEPVCVTAYLPSPDGHTTPFSVCVDCRGCLCKWCYDTTARCEHGLCQPCAEKATYKCYACNTDVIMCARFCKRWNAARRHYPEDPLRLQTFDLSPHVLCPVCDYRADYNCTICKEMVCPCCIDIHEADHVHTRK